ncbi:MAG: hypothetical protein IKW46_01410 [Bacteroidaceae bacterium]|nr:hypothetical protein [Bacteroidaceae bacterium]
MAKNDLFALGTHLDIPTNMPYYKKGWTEYYIVNLIIFVVLYLLALFANWWIKRIIKKTHIAQKLNETFSIIPLSRLFMLGNSLSTF